MSWSPPLLSWLRHTSALAAVNSDGKVPPHAHRFVHWLADHWQADGTTPPRPADTVSRDERGIPAMYWYAVEDAVLGCVPGASGCYVVPDVELLAARADTL